MKKTNSSELRQRVWAIIDGIRCIATNLTYAQAEKKLKNLSGNCTIVTDQAAARLPETK